MRTDHDSLVAKLDEELRRRQLEHPIIWRRTVGSTNTLAKEMALSSSAEEGTLVLAEHQTAGRGRRGRQWVEEPGSSILLSLILRPHVSLKQAGSFMVGAGVATAEAIRQLTGLPAGIKWPNDIYIRNKKVAGILVDTVAENDRVKVAVLGVGINCNQGRQQFPREIRGQATSLAIEVDQRIDRVSLIAEFLQRFDDLYRGLSTGVTHNTFQRWRQLSITLGERVVVTTPTATLTGMAQDVTDEGLLVLGLDHGGVTTVSAGDVSLRLSRNEQDL